MIRTSLISGALVKRIRGVFVDSQTHQAIRWLCKPPVKDVSDNLVTEAYKRFSIYQTTRVFDFLRVVSNVNGGLCLRRISLSFRCPTGMGIWRVPQ